MATAHRAPAFAGETLQRFAERIRGPFIQPADPVYDRARALYNGMIDKRPALIVQAANVADVVSTVNFARDNGLLLAIRGGGHNGGGLGSCDGGVVLDLINMDSVRVNPATRMVRVEGGATLGQVDHATHAFSLAVPAGIIGTTGVGGLTLGGGIGHLTRKFGLTIDSLRGVDMVLADGRFVTASADEHPDLFWAVRGGGGNFGVVTTFLFHAHPVHTVIAGPTFWPLEQTPVVLRWYRSFIKDAPEDLNGFFAMLKVPPVPVFPAELHGQTVAGVVWCYTGAPEAAETVFAPIKAVGNPLLHAVGPMPYPALQSMFDPLLPPGLQWYWRADFFDDIPDEAIELHLAWARQIPTLLPTMHLYPVNGAAHRVGRSDTAFSYRDATWAGVFGGIDPDPANAGAIRKWASGYQEALHPYSSGGAYVNFMMDEGQERVRATYRDNYDRLAHIKAIYDPHNLFRVNQNIRPA